MDAQNQLDAAGLHLHIRMESAGLCFLSNGVFHYSYTSSKMSNSLKT
jgi:hypothetical protein